MFEGHYHEDNERMAELMERRGQRDLKVRLWNALVDSEMIGATETDISVVPRIIPWGYARTIARIARLLTEFKLRVLSDTPEAIESLAFSGVYTDALIGDLDVLGHKKKRLVGGARYDFVIEGEMAPENPPKLLEINGVAYGAAGKTAMLLETLAGLFPELGQHFFWHDTASGEVRNMRRGGKNGAILLYDGYD